MNDPREALWALGVLAIAGCGKTSVSLAAPSQPEPEADPVTITPVPTLAPAMPQPPAPRAGLVDGDAVPPPLPSAVPIDWACRSRAGCMHERRPIEGRIRRIGSADRP